MVLDPRFTGLRVIAFNYEALGTKAGAAALKRMVITMRCLVVCDESHRIKNPKGLRVQPLYQLAKHMPYRRVLTGTPGDDPEAIYGQYLFLDEDILGYRSLVAYRAHFSYLEDSNSYVVNSITRKLEAKYGREKARMMRPQVIKRDPTTGAPMYRNLDELRQLTAPYSYRVLKKDCLDLPLKVYSRRYVELTQRQQHLYSSIRDEYIALYDQQMLTAPLAITRRMRMAQVIGGFFSPDGTSVPVPIDGGNPKLQALQDVVAETAGKVVIWARFRPELDLIAGALEKEYGSGSVARYWGGSGSAKDRDAAKDAFVQSTVCRFFVAQQQAGGTGLDGLQVANTVVFFSNDESLITRLQAEDRAHRGGSEIHDKVTIIDIEAEDTLDKVLLDAFVNKKEVADSITGDDPRRWL
jgi:SNF2 family DNA or RNA helicase